MMLGTSIILHKKKAGPPVKLSLVALMDIFTILVFFLLLNSGDSQTLEDAKFVKLPNASASTSPHSNLVIHVGQGEVWVDKEKVIDVANIDLGVDKPILPLASALDNFVKKHGELNDHEMQHGLSVTIMADRAVPYALLKSIMATCSGQNFRDISLAVNRVAAEIFNTNDSNPFAADKDSGSTPNAAPSAESGAVQGSEGGSQ